jgi:Protein of unknown function (DUF4238)
VTEKKGHHFVAQTYLEGFCNEAGKVRVYWKDDPAKHWWALPESVGFENYYYSQPTPDGGQDNNRLEDLFSSIETNWPAVIAKIRRREHPNNWLDNLLLFALMHRVRVPTMRNAAERMLAEAVRMTARHLNDLAELPAPPAGLTFEYLDKNLKISIDPHKSIHAMLDFAKGVNKIFQIVGYKLIENKTSEAFITSDNPVIYFDPAIPPELMHPYSIDRQRLDVELMFPINSHLMLWGHSKLKRASLSYQHVTDTKFVKRANILAARFANRMVFSNVAYHQPLIEKYGNLSPVISVTHLETPTGRAVIARFVFGKREPMPKWRARESAAA